MIWKFWQVSSDADTAHPFKLGEENIHFICRQPQKYKVGYRQQVVVLAKLMEVNGGQVDEVCPRSPTSNRIFILITINYVKNKLI